MPAYFRFDKLPPKDQTIERPVLDLKTTVGPKPCFEKAKDVAAFANHLGGVLLIGATEVDGHVGAYAGIPVAHAAAVHTAYSQSVAQRCSPKPIIDFEQFPAETPGNVVLAVFVEPYVGGHPVGVEVKKGEYDPAYVFPIRSGKDAVFLLPEQLTMYSEPRLRRVFVMLSAIPIGCQIKVVSITQRGIPPEQFLGILRAVSLDHNVVRFDSVLNWGPVNAEVPKIMSQETQPRIIALDQIRFIVRGTADDALQHQWNIYTEPFV